MNNNAQQKFVEDVLQQEEFTVEELLNAKHKHPFKHWLKLQWFYITDTIELEVAKMKGRTRRILAKLSSVNDK